LSSSQKQKTKPQKLDGKKVNSVSTCPRLEGYWESRVLASVILNLNTRCSVVVDFTPRTL